MALVLVIGIPLIGVIYYMDQYRDPGPSLVDRTIQAAEEAVRKNPNVVGVRFALGQAYADAGRYQEAIGQFGEILKVQPTAAEVLLARGRANLALAQLDAAASDFQAVVDTKKSGEMANTDPQLEEAYLDLGMIELKRGNPKEAVLKASAAVKIDRTDADALNLLGSALIETGDLAVAVDAFDRAVALVPSGWCDPYQGLATAYAGLKDAAGLDYANGMVAFCQKRYAEAKTLLDGQTSGPHAVPALVGLGLMAEEELDTAAARDAYKKALAMDPQDFAAITGLGRVSPGSTPIASPSASAPAAS